MAWYDEARFYHIYPLGLLDAPKQNEYSEPEHRLRKLSPWIDHIKNIGCNAIYIGPLFESVGHGYETTDYKKLDSRLGDNDDLKNFVKECHEKDVKVIFDGVFNHTGRDFFAFKDLLQNRENSRYRDWFCNVNFYGNNEYNDGLCYDNWGGYNLLVKLNQRNPEVKAYIEDVIRFWVKEFDVDGIRLDAADVLDFDFMKCLRAVANDVKPDFWLMGEVIHGDYNRWVNEGTLHSVTNYQLHKALYSGHNDHNYFEIAHTVNRLYDMGGRKVDGLRLYNFVDNHDVERLYTKLSNKEHFIPIHILMYTLPGVPSIYYGSEFAIEGKKERGSDDSLRPALNIEDYADAIATNKFTNVIAKLGQARSQIPALSYGEFNQLALMNRQYVYNRVYNGESVIVGVNNDDNDFGINVPASNVSKYVSVLTGEKVDVNNGNIYIVIKANSGDIWVPDDGKMYDLTNNIQEDKVGIDVQEEVGNEGQVEASNEVQEEVSGGATEEMSEQDRLLAEILGQMQFDEEQEETNEPEVVVAQSEDGEIEIDEEIRREVTEQTARACKDNVKSETEEKIDIHTVEEYKSGFEKGRIAGLQEAVLALMSKNGPITDQMRNDVYNQTHIGSLINWIKSFN